MTTERFSEEPKNEAKESVTERSNSFLARHTRDMDAVIATGNAINAGMSLTTGHENLALTFGIISAIFLTKIVTENAAERKKQSNDQ